jgi:hypothetical protein
MGEADLNSFIGDSSPPRDEDSKLLCTAIFIRKIVKKYVGQKRRNIGSTESWNLLRLEAGNPLREGYLKREVIMIRR